MSDTKPLQVYYARNREKWDEIKYERYLSVLPPVMQARIRRYYRWQDAQASLLGKLLLLEAWKPYGLDRQKLRDLQYTEYQRPFLPNTPDFNITHSGDLVACAISADTAVGIDIEVFSKISLSDFNKLWTEREWKEISENAHDLSVFFSYWARKEAVIKAEGRGMSIPLQDIDIQGNKGMVYNKDVFFLYNLKLDAKAASWLATDKPLEVPPVAREITF